MQTLIVKTDTAANARFLAEFLKEVKIVKKVTIENKAPDTNARKSEYDWINPSRPATNEEFEQMISEAKAEYKAGLVITSEELRNSVLRSIRKCRTKNIK